MNDFIHLHTHSDFSPQDGAQSTSQIAERAAKLGMNSVALTDHGRCGGLLSFKKACNKAQVKPIYGLEAYVAPESRLVKEKIDNHKKTSYHLTLLAKNREGLANLFRLTSIGWREGFYYKPRVDIEMLRKHSSGLVVLSGCGSGRLSQYILDGRVSEITSHVKEMIEVWGDDFYIEVQNHGFDWQQGLRKVTFSVAETYNIPIVATQDSHYQTRKNADLHRAICRLAAGDLTFEGDESYFKSYDDMVAMFDKDEQHAVNRAQEVANKCNCEWEYGKTIWPVYDLPDTQTPENKLKELTYEGFNKRFGEGTEEYRDRIKYELELIEKMGFPTYFLVVADFISWAKAQGIPVGPGRGSGAGSLVCYCLGITEVDPIKYGLYFERFLNPARVSLPDLDIDFCKRRRGEVMAYVIDKYGEDKVAQIGTYAVFKPRGSLRDFSRVLGYTTQVGDQLSSMVPPDIAGKSLKFEQVIEAEPGILKTDYKDVVSMARSAEGLISQAGVHAAGIVISNSELQAQVPLFRGKHNEVATQFDMHYVEEIGLVKFDFLGLKNLTVIQETTELVKQHKDIDIDIETINEFDKEVFNSVFQQGRLDGIFQFETSSGFRDLCIQVRPTSIDDLSIITSLFRPGPLCLSENTSILTGLECTNTSKPQRQGFKYKKLKDIYNIYSNKSDKEWQMHPLWLVSHNETTGKFTKNKIKKVWRSGTKPVYRIVTRTQGELHKTSALTGRVRRDVDLRSTLDHRFLTLNGWKRLGDIRPGEYLCLVNKIIGNTKPRSDCKTVYGRKNFRNIAFYHYQYHCVFCDWQEGSLDVNHIEGNRNTNNNPDNLSYLCPNHHRKYSEGNISKEELVTAREKYRLSVGDFRWVRFERSELAGEEETYDIEVAGPNHNFIANDLVVHNSTGLTQRYVEGRNGKAVQYLIPELEPILYETFGVMCFQEQIMRICTNIAGYTLAEADNMRKIIGKKLPEKMKSERAKFVSGCINNNVTETNATKLFDDIEGFAKYSFNKAHSVAYSIISYQTAWLKTYYPEEFYCALFNSSLKDQDDLVKYFHSCREDGIPIQPPDVNISDTHFVVNSGTIIFGLAGVKGLGEKACQMLMELRPDSGFESIEHMISCGIKKGTIKALAACGALEEISDTPRESLLYNIESIVKHLDKLNKWEERNERIAQREADIKAAADLGQKLPRRLPKNREQPELPELMNVPEEERKDRLTLERQTLGFYLTGHPMDSFPGYSRLARHSVQDLKEGKAKDREKIQLPAVISALSERRTRKNQNMAVLTVEDKSGRLEATIFPKQWKKIKSLVEEDTVNIISGVVRVVQIDGDSPPMVRIIVNSIKQIHEDDDSGHIGPINIKLFDGSIVKFIPPEDVNYSAYQQALAMVSNIKRME